MSKNTNDMSDDLLVKYLLNEADEAEQQQVQQWCNTHADNKRYFEQFRMIWEESRQLAETSNVDVEDAWMRFNQGLENRSAETPVIPIKSKRLSWLRVAAAVFFILIGVAALYFFANNDAAKQVTVQSMENVVTDTLPDGSIVTLNKQSSLAYSKKFTGPSRDVTLKGEAFFNVVPNKNKPFIITVNDVTVTVVGTSFNIKSIQNKTEVIVETGIVEVAKEQKAVRLKPQEKIVVVKDKALAKQKNTDELYNYYRTKKFECHSTPLWRVVEMLNEVYHDQITIENDRIKNLPITTTLIAGPLDGMLALVSQTLGIQVEEKNGHFILR